jgi:hypothetical protein
VIWSICRLAAKNGETNMADTKCFIKFSSNDQRKLKLSTCLFTISVGQQTHEGEYFRSTVDLLSDSFQSCVMLVDDSLQRHTMAIGREEGPDFFYDTAIEEGNLWLERNRMYYSRLKNLRKIVRWDAWLKHPKFNETKKAIKKLINEDSIYARAFSDSINEFVAKRQGRVESDAGFDINRAKKLSFDFILEECAALCLWTELGCDYEVYPNLHNAAINGTRERFVRPHYPQLLKAVTLGFRNAKQLLPQRFICLQEQETMEG